MLVRLELLVEAEDLSLILYILPPLFVMFVERYLTWLHLELFGKLFPREEFIEIR